MAETNEKTVEKPEEATKEEKAPEEMPEEEASKGKPAEKNFSDFLSPMALIMFMTAGFIDLLGMFLLLFGLDDLGVLDTTGLIFVGGLMYLHSGTITKKRGMQEAGTIMGEKTQKSAKKILKRLGLSFLGEIIPYFGNLAPLWTITVYFHLKGK